MGPIAHCTFVPHGSYKEKPARVCVYHPACFQLLEIKSCFVTSTLVLEEIFASKILEAIMG